MAKECVFFAVFPALFSLFPGRFLVVMVLAQALVIGRVDEQRPIPSEGPHMVQA